MVTVDQDITTLTNSIEGEVGGIWVPFGTPINGCDTTNPKCPIASATAAVYTLSLPIKSEYPKVTQSFTVKHGWRKLAYQGEVIF